MILNRKNWAPLSLVLGSTLNVAEDYARKRHIPNAKLVSIRSIDSVRGIDAEHLYNADNVSLDDAQWQVIHRCFSKASAKPRVIPTPI